MTLLRWHLLLWSRILIKQTSRFRVHSLICGSFLLLQKSLLSLPWQPWIKCSLFILVLSSDAPPHSSFEDKVESHWWLWKQRPWWMIPGGGSGGFNPILYKPKHTDLLLSSMRCCLPSGNCLIGAFETNEQTRAFRCMQSCWVCDWHDIS